MKNAEGVDSPLTCKNHQKAQFARWLKKAGVDMACDADGVPAQDIEISPLFAANMEDFVERWNKLAQKPEIKDGFYLE